MTIHTFEPSIFHITLGSHEPVLKVADGDTIITWCVDNAGRDAQDRQITASGNPQTGPFYVEDARPGDTLAVTFDRIWPNRKIGRTAGSVAPNIVDPHYVNELPRERERDEWDLDLERGTARLIHARPGLEALQELAFEPMIGCFGVAPERGQVISSSTSGPYGGNMDYRGFGQGATVYFPVFVEGALFHLGDGHAVQGDGEIVGTGIEVSFDVQFTVRVLRGKTIRWPRAENEHSIMAAGNARPLDQAAQHATTELMRWLAEDYGLDSRAASILLGQCIRYDIGNIFDPAFTMIARIEKRYLRK